MEVEDYRKAREKQLSDLKIHRENMVKLVKEIVGIDIEFEEPKLE